MARRRKKTPKKRKRRVVAQAPFPTFTVVVLSFSLLSFAAGLIALNWIVLTISGLGVLLTGKVVVSWIAT